MFKQDTEKNDVPGRTSSRIWFRRCWTWMLAAGLLCVGAYVLVTQGAKAQQGSPRAPQVVPVMAVEAKEGDIGIYLSGLGSVTSLNTVTVKTRVDGQLMKVLFQEGQVVSSGFLLAEIDPRPYEVMLTQAEGQMARDQALLKNAVLDLQRYRVLVSQDSIAKQQLDTQEALVRQYEGAVKFDQGLIDNAKLQLTYSRITAPISGRIGLRLVDPGNIVHAGDANGIAVITQLQPIAVIFSIPEDNLQPVLRKLKTGEAMPVDAYDREQRQKLATGRLTTVDNQIDPNTGTVRLKAVYPNKDNELFPNQFVNVRLLLDVKRGTVVVPAAAIQRSSQGTFVFLVKDDKTVTARPVRLGASEGDNVSVDEGLAPGDLLVVEGSERLREGSKVELKGQGADTPRKAE